MSNKAKIDEQKLKQALAEQHRKQELESNRRRKVFDAIVALSDCVSESILLEYLNVLDINSWLEVAEERYLGKLCGFPLCNERIIVSTKQTYHIDKRLKKVYESSSLSQKFCSVDCLRRFEVIQSQLYREPLWVTGDRPSKKYSLFILAKETLNPTTKQSELGAEFEVITQSLVTNLYDLKIADHAKSDNEEVDGAESELEDESKIDDDNFVHSITTFITTRSLSTSCTANKEKCSKTSEIKSPIMIKLFDDRDEKLAKIRAKYGKYLKEKRAPPIIEAKHIEVGLDKKITRSHADDFAKIFRSWISPTTIKLVNKEERDDFKGLTCAELLVQKFYDGDLASEKRQKKQRDEKLQPLRFPLVDNIDQNFRRIEILKGSLKSSWTTMITRLGIDFSLENANNLIASFELNSENCVLEKVDKPFAVAAIFELACRYDNAMKPWMEENRPKFEKFIESLDLPSAYFQSLISDCITAQFNELFDGSTDQAGNES